MQTLDLRYIKNRRNELGITLQEAANQLGMKNASTYMKYENGTYSFKAEQLPALAKTLNCKIANFFNQGVAKIATSKNKEVC